MSRPVTSMHLASFAIGLVVCKSLITIIIPWDEIQTIKQLSATNTEEGNDLNGYALAEQPLLRVNKVAHIHCKQ